MSISLTRVVKPAVEPVTLEALKKSLHITHSEQDDTLNGYLKAGRVAAEDYQRRSLITQQWQMVFDCYPVGEIALLRGAVQSVESVVVTDEEGNETTMDLSDFIILTDCSPARMLLKSSASWPSATLQEIGGIRISYTAGYGDPEDVPDDTKHAIIIFASFADDNRGVEDEFIPKSFYNLLESDRLFEGIEDE